ncbi:hypothetical protein E2562_006758 [Oryza meyeriana var. granulata]|uniref:HTH myb-type domain-containing protein n=1 Tax=Oryza meyeriana var. granulata TaxID=110450 RepID=A0A6G1C4D3_9ORYZ|nr:hypothetical protein E2562_006758 [Oryza meyeriana var. granulata]
MALFFNGLKGLKRTVYSCQLRWLNYLRPSSITFRVDVRHEKKGNGKGAEPTNPIQNRPKPLQHTQNLTLKGLLTYQGTPLV